MFLAFNELFNYSENIKRALFNGKTLLKEFHPYYNFNLVSFTKAFISSNTTTQWEQYIISNFDRKTLDKIDGPGNDCFPKSFFIRTIDSCFKFVIISAVSNSDFNFLASSSVISLNYLWPSWCQRFQIFGTN